MTNDVFVQLVNFPTTTREAVTENEDGSYTIFINARLGSDEQIKAYEHAMHHINEHDFQKCDVQQIEHDAHNKTAEIRPLLNNRFSSDEFIKRIRRRRKVTKMKIEEYEKRRLYLESLGYVYNPEFPSPLDNYYND